MGDTKPFQLIVVAICIVLTIVGVMVFSFGGNKVNPDENYGPEVVVWGTEDEQSFNNLIRQITDSGELFINARYEEKDEITFNQDLLEALASGKGPDVILADVEDLLTYQNKILIIPYENLSQREFQDSFIQEGELFATEKGYSAIPFSIDPLVLYWNRDIFTMHNKTTPPSRWGQVISLVPELRDISEDLTVFEAVVSLGDYRNVSNAKEILATLMLQSGTPVTELSYKENIGQLFLSSKLNTESEGSIMVPGVAAVNFYTQFADPLSKQYTWNRSLPQSLDMFASDDLAMYIGFGNEAKLIRSKNPNLNFDMALLPQSDVSSLPITYGKMKGLAIMAASQNSGGAFLAIKALTSSTFLKPYGEISGLPPVRRDLLADIPGDAFSSVLYRSALYARGFLDPDPARTNTIFQTMIESVLSGRSVTSEAVRTADQQLNLLADEFNQKQNRDE
jgi:ABC-type glycerol-3-phosphate transport system substrate-binding protein